MKKLLLVTFPVDLGNTTYEKRFINLFQNSPEIDLKIFRFAPTSLNTYPLINLFQNSLEIDLKIFRFASTSRNPHSLSIFTHIELYKSHDIFVLPINCDSYPSVLGEAACAGLAILTTKNALGASEVIQNGENGYICDSSEALLEKLTSLIKNKELLVTMKQNSRKLMEKEFADEIIFNEYIRYIFE